VPRYDVVQGQVARLPAAVLAGIAVALEDLLTTEAHLRSGSLDHVDEADDGRQSEDKGGAAESPSALLQHLSLASVKQDEGSPGVADVERLVVLIEDEYG
jgi:hypothetical protein